MSAAAAAGWTSSPLAELHLCSRSAMAPAVRNDSVSTSARQGTVTDELCTAAVSCPSTGWVAATCWLMITFLWEYHQLRPRWSLRDSLCNQLLGGATMFALHLL